MEHYQRKHLKACDEDDEYQGGSDPVPVDAPSDPPEGPGGGD